MPVAFTVSVAWPNFASIVKSPTAPLTPVNSTQYSPGTTATELIPLTSSTGPSSFEHSARFERYSRPPARRSA